MRTADEARQLLEVIPTDTIAGLRDRALIGVMVYSFARVGAVIYMRWRIFTRTAAVVGGVCTRRAENSMKWAHHKAEEFVFAYLEGARIADERKGPLFRTLNRYRELTQTRIHPNDVLRMIKRYCRRAGLSENLLPYFPGDRHHNIFAKWRHD